jgi:hypothetical protein
MNIGMESSCGCANWCAVAEARRGLLNAMRAAKKASGVFGSLCLPTALSLPIRV